MAAAIGVIAFEFGTPAQAGALPIGHVSEWWQTYNPGVNPSFSAKEFAGGIQTRAVGDTIEKCETKWIKRTYMVPQNTNSATAVLTMVADFSFSGTEFNLPSVEIEILENGNRLGAKTFFGNGVIGSYNRSYLGQTGYIELGSAIGTHVIPLSRLAPNVKFSQLAVSLRNYTCKGENTITLYSLDLSGGQ
jgi:hypothetical protein